MTLREPEAKELRRLSLEPTPLDDLVPATSPGDLRFEKARYSELQREILRLRGEQEKHRNSLVQAKEAAEEANRAKSVFLTSMSHEMRTPLSAVIGIAELLNDQNLDRESKRYVSRISTNARALQRLIEDILDFAKLEAGHFTLVDQTFAPSQVLENVYERQYDEARQRGLTLNHTADEALPQFVRGDEARVEQILINLVSNALKFSKVGGVTIRATSSQRFPNGGVRYEVTDTGPGIAPEQLEKIFERFFRGETSAPGTGLGLSICQQLAKLMKGEISVLSKLGKGSTFVLEIPHPAPTTEQIQERVDEQQAQPIHEVSKICVLLVEDDPDNRGLMARYLERAGCEVDTAQDGEVAREKIKRRKYHALVSDVSMPRMDGYELVSWLRRYERGSNHSRLPVIFVTAHALREHAKRAKEVGADCFLTKPVSAGELTGELKNLVGVQVPKVLVVDDAQDSRMLVRKYLQRAGGAIEVFLAETGQEAEQLCEEHEFRCVLLDVELGEESGIDVARRIEQKYPNRTFPLFALTAHTDAEVHERCKEAGCRDVLQKPVRCEQLLSLVRPHLKAPTMSTIATPASAPQDRVPADEKPEAPVPDVVQATSETTGAEEMSPTIVVHVPRDISDLVPGFLSNRTADVTQLREHLNNGEMLEVRRIGHGIKGTGGAYGFLEITKIGGQLEAAALVGDADQVVREIDRLEGLLERIAWRPR